MAKSLESLLFYLRGYMLKKIFLLMLSVIFCIQGVNSWEFVIKDNEIISLEPCENENLPACQHIFIEAFSKAYAEFTPDELGVIDKILFLEEAFADVYDDVQQGLQKLTVAKKEGKVIGFVGFKKTEMPNQIYISQLAVDPEYWQRGIGKHLVWSVFNQYRGY